MKILLVDDHPSFCEGLIAALSTIRNDYQVDFESDSELVPRSLLGRTDYDLFIMDLMMPGLGGVEIIKYLNKNRNHTPVMVMSSVQDPDVISEIFKLGIVGYMPKSYSVHQIIYAIEECREGNIHIPSFLEKETATQAGGTPDTGEEVITSTGMKLTKRQIEILSLMDSGLSNQEIADTLFISKATVKTHINHLFRAFDVSNRISCLRAAKASGILIGG